VKFGNNREKNREFCVCPTKFEIFPPDLQIVEKEQRINNGITAEFARRTRINTGDYRKVNRSRWRK
jgi:hypothetical protein